MYNPDEDRLLKCLDISLKQFDEIIIFDNIGNKRNLFEVHSVVYLTENENKGIAYALNRIMERAKADYCEWVVTLDQDTIIPDNMVESFRNYTNLNKVAIICPQVIDRRRLYLKPSDRKEPYVDIDYCITSASCTNIKIWEKLGGYDEWLFIDFVDGDYCKRLNIENYRIIQLSNIVIDQEFGNISLKSPWKVKFFLWLSKLTHNKNVAKLTYNKKVSPMRVYYVHRNLLYLNKKFKNFGGIGYRNFYCNSFRGFLVYFTLPSIVRGTDKITIMKAVVKGLYDGYKSKPTIYNYHNL